MVDLKEIAAACPVRTEALVFGPGDYTADLGVPRLELGMIDPEYPGHQWRWPMSSIAAHARASGLQAIDGPYVDFKDPDGYRGLNLGQQDAVERGARSRDELRHVAVAPGRSDPVHAYDAEFGPEVERRQRLDDERPGADLLAWGAGVLEVHEHLVGGRGGRLLDHARVGRRDREARAAKARRSCGAAHRKTWSGIAIPTFHTPASTIS